MKTLPLRRSLEYKARVRCYAVELAQWYRQEVADVFLANVKAAEGRIRDNSNLGTDTPYTLSGQNLVLKEWYFESGPAGYCLIYLVASDYIGLVSLWHGRGSRNNGNLTRIWPKVGGRLP